MNGYSLDTPAVNLVYERLCEALIGGDYAPGQALPGHRAWAKTLDTSTLTVFRAMARLKTDGIVDATQGSRTILQRLPVASGRVRAHGPGDNAPTVWHWSRLAPGDAGRLRELAVQHDFEAWLQDRYPFIRVREDLRDLPRERYSVALAEALMCGDRPTIASVTQSSLRALCERSRVLTLAEALGTLSSPHRKPVRAFLETYLSQSRTDVQAVCRRPDAPASSRAEQPELEETVLLPSGMTLSMVVYDRNWLERADWPRDRLPRDWDEFSELCTRLAKLRDGRPALLFHSPAVLGWWLMHLPYQGLPDLSTRAPELDWDAPATGRAMGFVQRLCTVCGGIEVRKWPDLFAISECLAGNVPIMVTTNNLLRELVQSGKSEHFLPDVLPAAPGGRRLSFRNAGGTVINAAAAQADQQAALLYAAGRAEWQELPAGRKAEQLRQQPHRLSDIFAAKPVDGRADLPAAWRQTIDRAESCAVWEPWEAEWTKTALGETMERLMEESPDFAADQLRQHLALADRQARLD